MSTSPSREKKQRIGAVLYALLTMCGLLGNLGFFGLQIFGGAGDPEAIQEAMLAGAWPAFAMLILYLPVPAFIDRYDPEPWWSVTMAFVWGALAATGISVVVNLLARSALVDALGPTRGELVERVLVAPLVEEACKGAFIVGMFVFLRREFDGVVDGIIYAVFAALGFAAVENVSYYAQAALDGREVFEKTFTLRGIVAPWGHPLYTSMVGIGVGVARESSRPHIRRRALALGFGGAVLLHAVWNFVPSLGQGAFVVSLLFWFAFVGVFSTIVIVLVRRKGAIIKKYLDDEVVFGTLTAADVTLITSAFGLPRTWFMPRGALWRRLIRAAARLSLSKWHTARAMKGKSRTFSLERIGPLRDEVKRLKAELAQ